jgi:N-methylhydantoinase A/oxoprolinase/acetone carboxylase beta subunit
LTRREAPAVRLGVDVGGTFTDLVLVDDAHGRVEVVKVPTTPHDSSVADVSSLFDCYLGKLERGLRALGVDGSST